MRQIILQILRTPDATTRQTFTPEDGEFVIQKDNNSLYVGDGATPGGNFLALIGSTAPITDAANVGAAGVGLFKQVNDTTLEFRNINAGSARITITQDTPNDEVDIDIDPSQILASTLNNDGQWETPAQLDARDTANRARGNHTGTQLANTISNFASTVLATVLTGFTVGANAAISATDSVFEAFRKIQGQLDNKYDASNPNDYETPTQLDVRDTANRARGNHTGTQLANTISNFAATVRSTLLTGYTVGANVAIAATDTILEAFGKIQGQLNNKYDASNPNNYETPTQLDARDTANRARGNHTGTQLANTISNFASTVRATLLTGYTIGANTAILATDTILQAFGKIQAQIDALVYGREYDYWSSEGLSTTTSSAFQPKLNVNTNSLTNGRRYRIEWYAEHINTIVNDSSQVQVLIDGNEEGFSSYEKEDATDWQSFSGFYEFTASSNGAIPLDMNFREQQGGTAQVRRARFSIRRVA